MARTVPVTTKDEYCEFGTPDDGEDVSGRSLPSDPALVYHVILSHLLNTCPVQSAVNNPEKKPCRLTPHLYSSSSILPPTLLGILRLPTVPGTLLLSTPTNNIMTIHHNYQLDLVFSGKEAPNLVTHHTE